MDYVIISLKLFVENGFHSFRVLHLLENALWVVESIFFFFFFVLKYRLYPGASGIWIADLLFSAKRFYHYDTGTSNGIYLKCMKMHTSLLLVNNVQMVVLSAVCLVYLNFRILASVGADATITISLVTPLLDWLRCKFILRYFAATFLGILQFDNLKVVYEFIAVTWLFVSWNPGIWNM